MFCIKLGANVTTNPALISFLRGTHENSASSYNPGLQLVRHSAFTNVLEATRDRAARTQL